MTNQLDGTDDIREVQRLSAADFGYLAGTDITKQVTTYTYTENYNPAASATGVDLPRVANFFQTYGSSTPPYYFTGNFINQTQQNEYRDIQTWWRAVTNNPNATLLNNTSFTDIINTLTANGSLIINPEVSSNASAAALQTQFDSLVNDFFATIDTSNFTSSSQYADAFLSYLQANIPTANVAQGITASANFISSSGGGFTFPSQYPTNYLTSQLTNPVFQSATQTALNNYMANFSGILSQVGQDSNGFGLFDQLTGSPLSASDEKDLFKNSLGIFLQAVDITNPNGPNYQNIGQSANYYDEWQQTAVGYTMIALSQKNLPGSYGSNTVFGFYQSIFESYYPPVPGQPSDFVPALLRFITQQLGTTTGFMSVGSTAIGILSLNNQGVRVPTRSPSGALTSWSLFLNVQTGGLTEQQYLKDGGFDQLKLIFDLYDKLLSLLNEIQLLTASQLKRQSFYQAFQSAYTSLLTKIPNATGASGVLSGYGSANSVNATAIQQRSDFSQLQTQFSESIKSFRAQVQQLSSAQNTSVNQSQESVTQQVNVAQTLIQQFGTILQSIWR